MADFGVSEAMLAMAAASAVTGAVSSVSQAGAARNQAALQRSKDSLALAEKQKENQDALAKTLASRNALYGATGTDASSGSALNVMMSAQNDANNNAKYLKAQGDLSSAAYRNAIASANSYQAGAITGSLLKLGTAAGGYYLAGNGGSSDFTGLSRKFDNSGYTFGGGFSVPTSNDGMLWGGNF